MAGRAIFVLWLSVFSSLANAHPLFENAHKLEVFGQTIFENPDTPDSAEVYTPTVQEDEFLAEGPIPFSSPASITKKLGQKDENAGTSNFPSWFTTTLLARRLLSLSSTGVFSTVFPDTKVSTLSGSPIGLIDYLADCDDKFPDYDPSDGEGNPTILGLRIGTTYRNIAAGSNLSISIDWWGRDSSSRSPASLPRLTLQGYLEELPTPPSPPSSYSELESCFLAVHPDAKWWLPDRDSAVHDGFWARMVVQEGYWIGGFGDVARIGWLNMTEWKGVREHGSVDGVGDGSGRGWGDVRLPGEKGEGVWVV